MLVTTNENRACLSDNNNSNNKYSTVKVNCVVTMTPCLPFHWARHFLGLWCFPFCWAGQYPHYTTTHHWLWLILEYSIISSFNVGWGINLVHRSNSFIASFHCLILISPFSYWLQPHQKVMSRIVQPCPSYTRKFIYNWTALITSWSSWQQLRGCVANTWQWDMLGCTNPGCPSCLTTWSHHRRLPPSSHTIQNRSFFYFGFYPLWHSVHWRRSIVVTHRSILRSWPWEWLVSDKNRSLVLSWKEY